jgi:hypothetical protein
LSASDSIRLDRGYGIAIDGQRSKVCWIKAERVGFGKQIIDAAVKRFLQVVQLVDEFFRSCRAKLLVANNALLRLNVRLELLFACIQRTKPLENLRSFRTCTGIGGRSVFLGWHRGAMALNLHLLLLNLPFEACLDGRIKALFKMCTAICQIAKLLRKFIRLIAEFFRPEFNKIIETAFVELICPRNL